MEGSREVKIVILRGHYTLLSSQLELFFLILHIGTVINFLQNKNSINLPSRRIFALHNKNERKIKM
jgi:hypothetical protein